jgi:hypothetical protein
MARAFKVRSVERDAQTDDERSAQFRPPARPLPTGGWAARPTKLAPEYDKAYSNRLNGALQSGRVRRFLGRTYNLAGKDL